MSYVFKLLAFPISPYLQRGINKIDRQKASKTIEKLLEHLVKTVVASGNYQTASNKSSGRPDVTAPETLPAPESIQDPADDMEITDPEATNLSFDLLEQDDPDDYYLENLLKGVRTSEGIAEVLSDHEPEEEVFGLDDEEAEKNPEVVTVESSRSIGSAPALPESHVASTENSRAPVVSDDVRMVLEYLLNEVDGSKLETYSSKSLEALNSSGSAPIASPGSAPPQDLDLDFSSSVVDEASSPPPKRASSDSNDPDEASPEAVEPVRPVMTPEPIQVQEIPEIQTPEPLQMVTPPRPRAFSFSSSEDSSDDDDYVKKLTSSGSAPPQDSDSDDSSDDETASPPPKRRPPILSSSSDSRDSDSSDSENEIVTVQKSGYPANQIAAPAALPASPRPVLTPESMDDMEITISQTINLSILLNQNTPASTPISSPSSSGTHPPSMKKSRASNIYEHIVSMCEYMKTDLLSMQIETLQKDLKARNRLYERYVEEGRLQPTEPNNKSRQEHLPIYVFLMAPKTKESYLNGFKNDKIPINATFHESIFKASMKNDEDTVELLLIYFLSPDTEKMKAKDLERKARTIAEGKEFRVEEDVIGVIKVESLEKVPDGSCFACFEKMPPISELQCKSLNCVVMNPSDQDQISILQQPGVKVSVNLEGLSIGKSQNPACKCFGPKVLVPTAIPKIFDNLASLFHRILYNKKGHSSDNIYVVDGFW